MPPSCCPCGGGLSCLPERGKTVWVPGRQHPVPLGWCDRASCARWRLWGGPHVSPTPSLRRLWGGGGGGSVIGNPWESDSILPHWLVDSRNHLPSGIWRSLGWQAWDQRSLKRRWNLCLWRLPRGTSGAKDSIWPRSDANSRSVAQSLWSKEDRRDCRRCMPWGGRQHQPSQGVEGHA